MNIPSFLRRAGAAGLALLVVCAGLPAGAYAQAPVAEPPARGDMLAQVLAAVARQPLASVPYIERRISVLSNLPLESRGTLSYVPGGNIEKTAIAPVRESVLLTAEAITLRGAGAAARVIRFDTNPDLAAYAFALRAALAGDVRALRQHFDPRLTGSLARWELALTPRQTAMKRAVKRILVSGEEGRLRVIETTESSGDVNELTLIPR